MPCHKQDGDQEQAGFLAFYPMSFPPMQVNQQCCQDTELDHLHYVLLGNGVHI